MDSLTGVIPKTATELPANKQKYKFVLLLFFFSVVLTLTIIAFYYWRNQEKNKLPPALYSEITRLSPKAPEVEALILPNIKEAVLTTDEGEQFNKYLEAADYLAAIYNRSLDKDFRITAQKLIDFLSDKYPRYYRPELLTIQCFDSTCTERETVPERDSLVQKISELDIDVQIKGAAIKGLERAAYTKSNVDNGQFNADWGALQQLKQIPENIRNEQLKQVIAELTEFIKARYPGIYEQLKSRI